LNQNLLCISKNEAEETQTLTGVIFKKEKCGNMHGADVKFDSEEDDYL
jgi:hypothetical protein